jgi:hypothetical protein
MVSAPTGVFNTRPEVLPWHQTDWDAPGRAIRHLLWHGTQGAEVVQQGGQLSQGVVFAPRACHAAPSGRAPRLDEDFIYLYIYVRPLHDLIYVPHSSREIPVYSLQQKMVMVSHETIRVAQPVKSLYHILKNFQKTHPVGIIHKDSHQGISPRRHMINCTRVFYPYWPGHYLSLYHIMYHYKT